MASATDPRAHAGPGRLRAVLAVLPRPRTDVATRRRAAAHGARLLAWDRARRDAVTLWVLNMTLLTAAAYVAGLVALGNLQAVCPRDRRALACGRLARVRAARLPRPGRARECGAEFCLGRGNRSGRAAVTQRRRRARVAVELRRGELLDLARLSRTALEAGAREHVRLATEVRQRGRSTLSPRDPELARPLPVRARPRGDGQNLACKRRERREAGQYMGQYDLAIKVHFFSTAIGVVIYPIPQPQRDADGEESATRWFVSFADKVTLLYFFGLLRCACSTSRSSRSYSARSSKPRRSGFRYDARNLRQHVRLPADPVASARAATSCASARRTRPEPS